MNCRLRYTDYSNVERYRRRLSPWVRSLGTDSRTKTENKIKRFLWTMKLRGNTRTIRIKNEAFENRDTEGRKRHDDRNDDTAKTVDGGGGSGGGGSLSGVIGVGGWFWIVVRYGSRGW